MNYTVFDAHCDTIKTLQCTHQSLIKNTCHIDIERMKKGRHIQNFAAFVDKENDSLAPYESCNQLIDCYYSQLALNEEKIGHCNTYDDILNTLSGGKVAALLSVEGGEAIEGSLEKLRYFYNRGVRIMTLCWNYKNEICEGVCEDFGEGLSSFGKKVVREMNSIGMIVDVSHASEKSFWDIISETEKPIMASHSNCYSLCNHCRNLKDEQIKAIIKNKGFIGINLYSEFLSPKESTVDDAVKHIEYVLEAGGENNVGLGTDFDGMDSLPNGIKGIEDIYIIPDTLLKKGYSEELVNKILYKNFLRLFKEVS